MSGDAPEGREIVGACTWCGADAFDEVVTSRDRAKKTTSSPACPAHVASLKQHNGLQTKNELLADRYGIK